MIKKGVYMKNDGLMIFGTLGAIILGFIAPLIVWLSKENLTPEEKSITAALFNFEISLFLACIVINLIPLLGQLVCLVLWIVNLVYALKAFTSVREHKPFSAPKFYEFVK